MNTSHLIPARFKSDLGCYLAKSHRLVLKGGGRWSGQNTDPESDRAGLESAAAPLKMRDPG